MGECYQKCRRAKEFIPNLLKLNVPQLLAVQSDTNLTVKEDSVCQKFSTFLKSYIQRNNLQPVILNDFKTLLSHMTDECHFNFHWIIFNVLQPVSSLHLFCVCFIHLSLRLQFLSSRHFKQLIDTYNSFYLYQSVHYVKILNCLIPSP